MSEYADRDIIAQGEHYIRHISAMTGEDLHDKSDIAAELAHRDIEIASLKEQLAAREAESEAEMNGTLALREECGAKDNECFPDFVRRLKIEKEQAESALEQMTAKCAVLEETLKNMAEVEDCHCGVPCDCYSWRHFVTQARKALASPQTSVEKLLAMQVKYNELLYAVGMKHPDESRHETALRYIRKAEQPSSGTGSQEKP